MSYALQMSNQLTPTQLLVINSLEPTPELVRVKTLDAINNAIEVVMDYCSGYREDREIARGFKKRRSDCPLYLITEKRAEEIKAEIMAAPHNDAISDIMSRLRHELFDQNELYILSTHNGGFVGCVECIIQALCQQTKQNYKLVVDNIQLVVLF